MSAQSADRLVLFDTTLRDGEQSPGVALTAAEKVEIAAALSRLGVDVCEAGFPVASDGDFDAVRRIAAEVGPLTAGRASGEPMVPRDEVPAGISSPPLRKVICALARAVEADIARAAAAVAAAPKKRIHTFLATSDIHLAHKLRISRDECVRRAVAAVKHARTFVDDVEFSPEDAGRSDRAFLCEVLGAVIEAGATTLNIPDTVGYCLPSEYGEMIKYLIANTPGSDKVIWSTHCHNDLGLATANTLAGIMNGARQAEVTINGIGERAGNTALEEIVMALYTHPKFFNLAHGIDTTYITTTSQLVTERTGMPIQPNKAIVGANAFAHESGIHQDGVLKHTETYEIIKPETVGVFRNGIVLGKHSGRHAFRARVQQLVETSALFAAADCKSAVSDSVVEAAFADFKRLADAKRRVEDADIIALLDERVRGARERTDPRKFSLTSVHVFTGTDMLSTATVRVACNKQDSAVDLLNSESQQQQSATGNGPVEAVFQALSAATGTRGVLCRFGVTSVTQGTDSLGKVTVALVKAKEGDDDTVAAIDEHAATMSGGGVKGTGVDRDILVASAKAYIDAVNRLQLHTVVLEGASDGV